MTPTTFSKLKDGSWGLRGPSTTLRPGAEVDVYKKDGTRLRKVVGRIVWSGEGTSLATIDETGSGTKAPKGPSEATKAAKKLRHKGRYECEECGEYVTPGTSCWETGCAH